MTSESVDVELGKIVARTWGDRGQDALVLLHGVGGNVESWGLVAPLLAAARFVVAVDLPGHGCSASPETYSIPRLADDVVEALRALGVQPIGVVGHSWGASVGVEVALRMRPTALVNVDGHAGSLREVFASTDLHEPDGDGEDGETRLSTADLEAAAAAQIAARSAQGRATLGACEVAVVRRNLQRDGDGFVLRPTARDRGLRATAFWEHDLTGALEHLDTPVLFAMSEDTRAGAALPKASRALRARVAEVVAGRPDRKVIWLNGGHNLPLEAPGELANAILEFTTASA